VQVSAAPPTRASTMSRIQASPLHSARFHR
jgi:hypothetical protein